MINNSKIELNKKEKLWLYDGQIQIWNKEKLLSPCQKA